MPRPAAVYTIDAYDPLQAAPAAAKELASLDTKYDGDLAKTLAGWNWGQGRVEKFGLAKMPTLPRALRRRRWPISRRHWLMWHG
jgi:soluble lytic murein transglycosylase-like protein